MSNWKEEIKVKQLWELSYKQEDYEEDNDTSEEEDEEPLDVPSGSVGALIKAKTEADKIAEELMNPTKGFKFFIEKEQQFLEKLEKRK